MRRLPPVLALLAATLLMMAVAFADGRPTVFYDSHGYDVMGRNAFEVIGEYPQSVQFKMKPGVKRGDPPVSTDRLIDPAVMGARSSFYGVLLHGAYLVGTLWLLAGIQSFLAAWVVYLLWRTMAPKAPSWSYLAVVAGSVLGSSLSFFTTFAMPDVFAGIGGAAVALILTQADQLKRREIVGLWLLCVYAMAVHKSHLGTGAVVAVAGAALTWLMGLPAGSAAKRMALVLSAALLAWAGGLAADSVYEMRTGYKLGHPPFIMASVLADGPGRAYMRSVCAKDPSSYALCAFQANVGSSTNLILWSDRKNLGVFNIANFATRMRMEREEMRFVIGAVLFDPVGQALASLENWCEQFVAYQVDDPLRNPAAYLRGRYWPTTALPKLIPNFEACRPPGDCRPPFNYQYLADWHGAVLVAALLLLGWRMTCKDVRLAIWRRGLKTREDPARVASVVLLLLMVAAVNAAICGILSGPFARYQSRLVWLLPVGAGLVACALPMGLGSLAQKARSLLGWGLSLWEGLRAWPVIGRFLPALDGHFFRFCVVGGIGFIVDFSVLKAAVYLGMNEYTGRLVSFPVAVTTTFLVNRAWTFRSHAGEHALVRELSTYFAVQSAGFAANLAVYSSIIAAVPALHGRLLPPMVAGTAAGLVLNYLGAKHFVFRRRARVP